MQNNPSKWSFEQDLDNILAATEEVFRSLQRARIFLTGGTGFIGCWLLESLKHANQRLNLNIQLCALTRNPQAFAAKLPHLAQAPGFTFIQGDVSSFSLAERDFSHVIHAATDASAHLNETNPVAMFDTVVKGTRHVLEFAADIKPERVLYLSSGAVYGQQPWELEKVPESWRGAPDPLDARAAYAEGKRAAEMMCAIYAKQHGLNISIARIFALLGPYLSLDIHFAAGNFIRDAMNGQPIVVQGNGLPCRSYLYAADLTIGLWHMLQRAEPGKAYNIGSDESISIRDLAAKVATLIGDGEYKILGEHDLGWNLGRYVPDTTALGRDLGVYKTITLDEAIRRTALWHGWKERH